MRYGKLENGRLRFAPNHLSDDGVVVYNPPVEMYVANGYKTIQFTAPPEAPDGYYYAPDWDEQENVIVQVWHLEDLPDDIDDVEALNIILGGTT